MMNPLSLEPLARDHARELRRAADLDRQATVVRRGAPEPGWLTGRILAIQYGGHTIRVPLGSSRPAAETR
jgi:hypothetical protein